MRVSSRCMRRRFCLVALLCCSYLSYGQATNPVNNRGVIEGTVINEKGHAIAQAQTYALGSGPTIAAVRYVKTDNNGHFRLDHLAWGTYHVFAGKVSAGYPKMSFNFYVDQAPAATVSPSSPLAVVTVRVGRPCGVLRVTSVTDAVTGKPIRDYELTLRRAADPHRFMSGTFSNPILIPPNVDVLIEVSANGYQTWPARSERKTSNRLYLNSGEVFNLNVKLRPSLASGAK